MGVLRNRASTSTQKQPNTGGQHPDDSERHDEQEGVGGSQEKWETH